MSVSYSRVNWENEPSTNTPLSAANLNKMDKGIDDVVARVNQLVDVEANPQDSSTDTLTKIGIDGTVYSISGGGGSSTLSGLSDVNISSATNGQVLKYDSQNDEWVNAADSGGSVVSVTQKTSTGTNIADITVDGSTTQIYAPNSGSTVSVSQKTSSGTNIADITIDGTTTQLYAPTSGGSSSLSGLSDVDVSSISNDQVLRYNSQTSKWENSDEEVGDTVTWNQLQSTGTKIAEIDINGTSTDIYAPTSGGAASLSGLSDVNISSAANKQVLTYNSSNQKWENKTPDVTRLKSLDMVGKTTTFNADGSISITADDYSETVTFNADGTITDAITINNVTTTKTITFNGSQITEVIS